MHMTKNQKKKSLYILRQKKLWHSPALLKSENLQLRQNWPQPYLASNKHQKFEFIWPNLASKLDTVWPCLASNWSSFTCLKTKCIPRHMQRLWPYIYGNILAGESHHIVTTLDIDISWWYLSGVPTKVTTKSYLVKMVKLYILDHRSHLRSKLRFATGI